MSAKITKIFIMVIPLAIAVGVGGGIFVIKMLSRGDDEGRQQAKMVFRARKKAVMASKKTSVRVNHVDFSNARARVDVLRQASRQGGADVPEGNLTKREIENLLGELLEFVETDDKKSRQKVMRELHRAVVRNDYQAAARILNRLRGRVVAGGAGAFAGVIDLMNRLAANGGIAESSGVTGGGQDAAQDTAAENVVAEAEDSERIITDADLEKMEAREKAISSWEDKIMSCGSETERLRTIKQGMLAFSSDEGACNVLSMKLVSSTDKALAVQTIVEIAAGPSAAAQVAQESYSWITGTQWTDAATAQAWAEAHAGE